MDWQASKLFLNSQDALFSLQVGVDRTMDQSPVALEFNDVDDTRISRSQVTER